MMFSRKLIHNYLIDNFKKKEIGHRERAEMLRDYLLDRKISIRTLAGELEIPKSTLEDWLLWNRLTKEEEHDLKLDGYTHSDIYRSLRNNKNKDCLPIQKRTKHYVFLEEALKQVRVMEKKLKYDSDTVMLIKRLQDQLNRVLMYMEKNK